MLTIGKTTLIFLGYTCILIVSLPFILASTLIYIIYDYIKDLINNPIKVIRKTLWIIIKFIVFFVISPFIFLIIAVNTAVAFPESYVWIAAPLALLNPSIVISLLWGLFFKRDKDKAGLALAEGELTVNIYSIQRVVRSYSELEDEKPIYDELLLVDIGGNRTLNLTSYLSMLRDFLPLRDTIKIYHNRSDPQQIYGFQTLGEVINEQQVAWSDDYLLDTNILLRESVDMLLTKHSKNMD